jgi:hypothetical protein
MRGRNRIKVLTGGVPLLSQKEFVVPIAANPLSGESGSYSRSKPLLNLWDRPGRAQIDARKTACPGKKMKVGIDKSRKDNAPPARNFLHTGRHG